jgi:ubiquinone/menaquinone biosynthesis C-methylase UbiE
MDFRTTFDDVAELYDSIRPRYPEALFAALVSVTGLEPGAHLLEIAPGTGQATEPLAARGYRITAVELGANMARIARKRLETYQNVEIINSSYEDADLPAGGFDLVYAATAFHWIDSTVRFTKTHRLLKQSGYLAVIYRKHVSDGHGDTFTAATQPIYQQYERDTAAAARTYIPQRRAELRPEPVDETLFNPVHFEAFPMTALYSADEYVSLLSTYSPTLSMGPEARASFLNEIRQLIHAQFEGEVFVHYAMTLALAHKK